MNKDYETVLFKVYFHMENIPNDEDINPEYVEFISERIQPRFDEAARRLWLRVWITFDKYGDLIGYIPQLRDSKIWVDFEPCET